MEQPKIYKQRYFLNENQTDSIDIYWKSGLKNFEIRYKNQLVKDFNNSEILLKGFDIFIPDLGNLQVKMHQKPFGFEVKVGNLYLINSKIPPENKLTSVSTIFYFVGIVSLIPLLIMFIYYIYEGVLSLIPLEMWAYGVGWLIFSSFYVVCGHLLKKGFLWPYFSASIIFSLITLAYISSFLQLLNPLLFFFILIRLFFLAIIISSFKSMLSLYKHRKAYALINGRKGNSDIIDNGGF